MANMFYLAKFFRQILDVWQHVRSVCSRDPLERCRWIQFPVTLHSRSLKPKDQLSRAGEEAAKQYLLSKGYSVLHRNIRFPEGELDVVAAHNNVLIFIEIKTRTTEKFGKPYEFVSSKKQYRQIKLAKRFLSYCRLGSVPVRFDIISIVWPQGKPPDIEHIKNAFTANDF